MRRASGANPLATRLVQLVLLAAFLGLWELGARNKLIDRFFYSMPSEIGLTIQDWLVTGILWNDVWITLQETLAGFVLGTIIGVTIGFILARSEWFGSVFGPLLVLLNGM